MFPLRCMGVSLAFFLLVYVVLSVAVMSGWRTVRRLGKRLSSRHVAAVLFTLRSLPLAAALVITLGFVVPSFLLLEPRAAAEPVGEIPLTLGACCLALFVAGVWNAVSAQVKTSRAVAGWLQGARAASGCAPVPLFRIRPSSPALTVAGWREPRVLLSDAAAALLDKQELESGLRHEIAHVRRRDNLKKLLFRLCAFPGLAALEAGWSEAAEMAADDAAVSDRAEALDLASALIKLSRFAPVQAATLTTGLVEDSGSALNVRIGRLVSWEERRAASARNLLPWYLASVLAGGILSTVMMYSVVLIRVHDLTEWLIR
jgi:Zn-dependent protease with chaperone function